MIIKIYKNKSSTLHCDRSVYSNFLYYVINYVIFYVGVVRVELTWTCVHRFLRPTRIPIPPHALIFSHTYIPYYYTLPY